MGYSISVYGIVSLKENTDVKRFLKEADELAYAIGFEASDCDADGTNISISIYDSHWHEKDTEDFINAVRPYIDSGMFEFRGEDDAFWRYVYNAERNEWEYEDGMIIYGGCRGYSDAELIRELEKRGYSISKDSAA